MRRALVPLMLFIIMGLMISPRVALARGGNSEKREFHLAPDLVAATLLTKLIAQPGSEKVRIELANRYAAQGFYSLASVIRGEAGKPTDTTMLSEHRITWLCPLPEAEPARHIKEVLQLANRGEWLRSYQISESKLRGRGCRASVVWARSVLIATMAHAVQASAPDRELAVRTLVTGCDDAGVSVFSDDVVAAYQTISDFFLSSGDTMTSLAAARLGINRAREESRTGHETRLLEDRVRELESEGEARRKR